MLERETVNPIPFEIIW